MGQCMVLSHSAVQCMTKRAAFVAPDRRPHLVGINLLHFGLDLVKNRVIEIVPSWHTAPHVVQKCKEFVTTALNRRCVVVPDAVGAVSSRLLAVYINEAFSILNSSS